MRIIDYGSSMDNTKYPANLDPKLKEAYERVMGLSKNTQPSPPPHHEKMQTQKPIEHPPVAGLQEVTEEVHTAGEKQKVVRLDGHGEKHSAPQSSGIMSLILGLIAALFFIGYGLFWAQIFGFNLLPGLLGGS